MLVSFGKTFSLAVTHNPVEEVESTMLVDGISADSDPVNDDRHCCEHKSGRYRKIEVS